MRPCQTFPRLRGGHLRHGFRHHVAHGGLGSKEMRGWQVV